eukprot:COSAG01_NODE_1164_length_11447_cov_19.221096_8_plen_57_part_00
MMSPRTTLNSSWWCFLQLPLRSAQALEAAKAVLELMTVTQEMLAELLEGSTLLQSI